MRTSTTQSAAGSGALEARGSVPSVNNHRIVPAPFACPEPRRAQPHPRKPFLATRHSLAQRRNTADEGPLTTEILIANLELEFRLTHRKIISLKISNRKKIAIFYPVFRRGAKTVLPPSFPSGRGFIPSVTDQGNISVPIVYPEDAPRRRRALTHPRKPSPFFPFWHNAASRRSGSAEFLIANARLEFAVSHSKEGPLRIPNREWIAISNRIEPPRPRSARHSPLNTRLPRVASPLTKGHCISNRNSRHFRISPNSHSGNTYAFSNRNKSEYRFRFGGTAFSNLAANHRAQFTRHSQPRRQIDPAAAHAYTDPSTEGESPWKTPSY